MSTKKDPSAKAKKSKKPEAEASPGNIVSSPSRPAQHKSHAPSQSTTFPAKAGAGPKGMAVHASTSIPRGKSMAPKTMVGSAASMRMPPPASMPPAAMPLTSKSMAPKTMRESQKHRERSTTQGPMEHRGTKLNRDDISQGTKLNRDDVSFGTKLNRDDIPQRTMLFRDGPTIKPATMAPPGTKSIFINPHDITMASRQISIDDLPPDERDEQEEWAQNLIKRSGACPQGYDWNRRDGGYQCHGGGHGITDEMLAEGKGGMWALPTKDWEVKDGPYYPRDGEWFRVKPGVSGN